MYMCVCCTHVRVYASFYVSSSSCNVGVVAFVVVGDERHEARTKYFADNVLRLLIATTVRCEDDIELERVISSGSREELGKFSRAAPTRGARPIARAEADSEARCE